MKIKFNLSAVALIVAMMFAFFAFASPPAFAAEKPEVKQSVKVLVIGEPSAAYVADIVAQLRATGVAVEVVAGPLEEPALELPDFPVVFNKMIFETARFDPGERVPIVYRNERQKYRIANYQPPATRFFSGFNNPARAKI